MAFEGLTEKLSAAFKKLRGKGRLSVADVKEAMREIRLALLEADVSYKVVKQFIAQVTEKAVGADVLEALSPAQMIIKIVTQELTDLSDKERNIILSHMWPLGGALPRSMEAWLVDAVDTLCAGLELSGIYDPSRLRRRLGVEPITEATEEPSPAFS